MKGTNTVTLRLPGEMKERLERLADQQGVSTNQLASYLLNRDLTQLEMALTLERRATPTSADSLSKRAVAVLDKVPAGEVPDWDRLD